MDIKITKVVAENHVDGSSIFYSIEYNKVAGGFSMSVFTDAEEIIYCIECGDEYYTWGNKQAPCGELSKEFKEAFEKCFGINLS